MQKQFKPKSLAFSVGLLCLAASFSVHAAPVTYGNYTIDAEYIIGASTGVPQDGMSHPSAWIHPDSNGADYYLNTGDWSDVSYDGVFFHTYGGGSSQDNASFGARASGQGSFFARTSVSYNATYTNTSSEAQNFTFTFGVSEGELVINGSGAAFAELLLRVRIDGQDVTSSRTTLVQDSSNLRTCSNTSVGLLSSYMDCNMEYGDSFLAPGRNYTLDLGAIAAGESFTLDYEIMSIAYGDLATDYTTSLYYVCDEWANGSGPEYRPAARNAETPDTCLAGHYEAYVNEVMSGGSGVRSGDPINPYWTPTGISGTFGPLGTVPEPSTLALLGLAFAGIGIAGRRKQRQ